LEPVRQFALLQLRQAGDEDRVRRQMADYFMTSSSQIVILSGSTGSLHSGERPAKNLVLLEFVNY
jgi:hypothetical protein